MFLGGICHIKTFIWSLCHLLIQSFLTCVKLCLVLWEIWRYPTFKLLTDYLRTKIIMYVERRKNNSLIGEWIKTDRMLCKLWKCIKLYIGNRWILVIVLRPGRGNKSQKIIYSNILFYKALKQAKQSIF